MIEENYLSDIMLRTNEIMRQRLEEIRDNLRHPGSKGNQAEDILREFLGERLPDGLSVGKGEIIDHIGNRSKECDVVIYDTQRAPVFFQKDGHCAFPAESVIAVVEVKTRLRKSDIPDIVESMKTVKALDRSAFTSPYEESSSISVNYNWYGRKYEFPPIMYFAFSFESDSIESIWQDLTVKQLGLPIDKRVDSVYCLDKGAMIWLLPECAAPRALPDTSRYWSLVPTKHALLLFYTLSYPYLCQRGTPMRFNVSCYLPSVIETDEIIHQSYPGCSTPEGAWQRFLGDVGDLV